MLGPFLLVFQLLARMFTNCKKPAKAVDNEGVEPAAQ